MELGLHFKHVCYTPPPRDFQPILSAIRGLTTNSNIGVRPRHVLYNTPTLLLLLSFLLMELYVPLPS